MFGNLIKILLLAVIIGAVVLFFQQRGWEQPTVTDEPATVTPAVTAEHAPEPSPLERPAPASVEDEAASAQMAESEAQATGTEGTIIIPPPEHPGADDTSPPTGEQTSPGPSSMQ